MWIQKTLSENMLDCQSLSAQKCSQCINQAALSGLKNLS